MTAPTSMPVMPAVARSSGPASSSSSSAPDGSPAFASALDSALDDALTGGGNAAGGAAGTTPGTGVDDAEQPGTAGPAAAVAPLPVVLVPGLWALMTAVTPLTGTATGTAATTAAASLIGAVTGTPVAGAGAGPGAPVGPIAPAAPATQPLAAAGADVTTTPATTPATPPAAPPAGTADPATIAVATATAATLAEAAGLSLVVDSVIGDGAAATGTPAAPAAPAADAGSTPLAAVLPTAGAGGPADPDAGAGSSTGGPAVAVPRRDEAPAPTADTDSVFTVGGTTQTTAAGPVAEVAQPPAPADDAPVAAQLGRHIAVLRNAPDGSQTMTVVITPETLGPVTIAVTVTAGSLDLTLQGSSEHGRHALLEALPDLRRDLEGAGLSLSRLDVGTSTDAGPDPRSAQQQLLDARAGQQGSAGQPGQQVPRPRTWGSVPDAVDGTPLTTTSSASAGVDLRV